MNINLIEYNGNHYFFKNLHNETTDMFFDRCWFIVKNIEKFKDRELLEKISLCWINHKYLGVTYSNEIMRYITSANSIYETQF